MLSLFPELLSFSLAAPVLLRLTLAVFFLILGLHHLKRLPAVQKEMAKKFPWAAPLAGLFGIVELAVAVLLFIGLWTQVVALVAVLVMLKFVFYRHTLGWKVVTPYGASTYVLLAIIALSLLVTGPGFIAFDLPL